MTKLPYFSTPEYSEYEDLMSFDRVHAAIDGAFVRDATIFDLPIPLKESEAMATRGTVRVAGHILVNAVDGIRMRTRQTVRLVTEPTREGDLVEVTA